MLPILVLFWKLTSCQLLSEVLDYFFNGLSLKRLCMACSVFCLSSCHCSDNASKRQERLDFRQQCGLKLVITSKDKAQYKLILLTPNHRQIYHNHSAEVRGHVTHRWEKSRERQEAILLFQMLITLPGTGKTVKCSVLCRL